MTLYQNDGVTTTRSYSAAVSPVPQRRRLLTLLRQLELRMPAGATANTQPCAASSSAADDLASIRNMGTPGITIEKIPNSTLGAVVKGISLNELDDASFRQIQEAFLEHAVLIFPNQHGLLPEKQAEFCKRFGNLEFESAPISNQKQDGAVLREDEHTFHVCRINESWHTDTTYMPLASKAGSLFAEGPLPPTGGGTEFCDLRAAYEALDEKTRTLITDLAAYHAVHYTFASKCGGYFPRRGISYGMHGRSYLRPLVKTHPDTKRNCLFLASHAFLIPGMSPEASQELLEGLIDFAAAPPRRLTHTWQKGDFVFWDNRCCLHRSQPYDTSLPRVLRGTRVAGDPETETAVEENIKVLEDELNRLRKLHGLAPEFFEGEVGLETPLMPLVDDSAKTTVNWETTRNSLEKK